MDASEARASFERDGAVVVRQLITAPDVHALREGTAAVVADPSSLAVIGLDDGGSTGLIEDFCNWGRVPEFASVIRGSRMAEIAAELMGSETARLFHDHLLVKYAGTSVATPWHQDQPYYCVDGRQTVSFWIALDHIPVESSLELLAGSHDGTWYMPRSFAEGTPMVFEPGSLADVPDVDDNDARVLSWALEPGDAVAFHMLALHRSSGSATQRRAFSVRWLGDDCRYAPRPHRTSPHFEGLDRELTVGAPFDHPLFPLLHPSATR